MNSPEVLFADEPTGALSVNQGKIILDILTELNQEGQSIVMVTHDLKAACRANRLIFIKDGSIGGMLELPKYTTEMTAERERQIYSFISRRE
ncbi:Macrolide export ATP-binding/permease protein MacB [compost metagenome]